MSCGQVKGHLSAYLDNALAPEAYDQVTTHLGTCQDCRALLADFRSFDTLLSQLPRVSPGLALRERIFSSPEYLELTGTFGATKRIGERSAAQQKNRHRPQLVALPGGQQPFSGSPVASNLPLPRPHTTVRRRHYLWNRQTLQIIIAAALLLVIGLGGLIGWKTWKQQNGDISGSTALAPTQGPLPAGIRFTFLRAGALWSAPTDGGTDIVRLTPKNVTVATNWLVRPAQPGRPAGNMLAYIDLQQGRVHIMRSDGQSDITLSQLLLKPGIQPSTVWDTQTGTAILSGLAWSKDGSMLAFIANPQGTTLPGLYIYSVNTGEIEQIQLPVAGTVLHPVWSPDGVRIAFVLISNGNVGIFDYNTQNHGFLTIASSVDTRLYPDDTVLTLDWSPNTDAPAITWSVGEVGHIHSIWLQRIGAERASSAQLLTHGDYAQATYSHHGQNNRGGWLLVPSLTGPPGDVLSLDLNATITKLTQGKQVSFAQWSPNGVWIDYFNALSSGLGDLHVINTVTGTDALLATEVVNTPLPTWSLDSQHLAYCTSNHILVANTQTMSTSQPLKLQGAATALSWSATSPHQLVVAMSDGEPGLYLVDTQQDTALQLDNKGSRNPIMWTQIP